MPGIIAARECRWQRRSAAAGLARLARGENTDHLEEDGFYNIDEPFYNGQLFTAEAFFEEPGVGLAGIEDIVIIWDDGVERLTSTPKTFW